MEIDAAGHSFRASSSSLKFSGYTAVYEEGKDEEKEEKESPLPALREGETLTLKDFSRDQHFTQPPAHYTDCHADPSYGRNRGSAGPPPTRPPCPPSWTGSM